MDFKIGFINKVFWFIVFTWTLLVIGIIGNLIVENYAFAAQSAYFDARMSTKKDIIFRQWNASRGGVYVPENNLTQPNPYLGHMPYRDIRHPDGTGLTMVNPAYMIRQMSRQYEEVFGIKEKITSLNLLNPVNAPDQWEREALIDLENNKEPSYGVRTIDGKEYYRYLEPLYVEQACLKCHGFQGYKEGELRGGISISIPMNEYYAYAWKRTMINIFYGVVLWLFGILMIYLAYKKARDVLLDKIRDYEQNIYSLVTMIEKRDRFTAGHTQRVAKYATMIAREQGYSQEAISELYTACILHDIGKISTPDSILLKPGLLSEAERKIIEQHVIMGYEMLKDIDIYRNVAEIIRHHHERYDGKGYPQHLKGDEIPKLSQILAIADTFDAMTTDRIYKKHLSVEAALDLFKGMGDNEFDKYLVQDAIEALKDVRLEHIMAQTPQNDTEKERFSYFYKDQITFAYNLDYLIYILDRNFQNGFRYNHAWIIYLRHFNKFNKTHGWLSGDRLLKEFSKSIIGMEGKFELFRIFGDIFIILSTEKIEERLLHEKITDFLAEKGVGYEMKEVDLLKDEIKGFKKFEGYI